MSDLTIGGSDHPINPGDISAEMQEVMRANSAALEQSRKQSSLLDDWQPRKMGNSYTFVDWMIVRKSIEAAYKVLGRELPSGAGIPTDEWNLMGLAIDAFAHLSRARCGCCGKPLWEHECIRCLDCKTPLCTMHASQHFWPNGRPQHEH